MLTSRIRSVGRFLTRGKLWGAIYTSLVSKVVTMVSSWIVLPLLAIHLGPEYYGIYVLYLSFLSVINLTDSGMGSAIVRYVARQTPCESFTLVRILRECIRFYLPIAALLTLGVFGALCILHRDTMFSQAGFYMLLALLIMCAQSMLSPVFRIYLGAGMLSTWNKYGILANTAFLVLASSCLVVGREMGLNLLFLVHALTALSIPIFAIQRLSRGAGHMRASHSGVGTDFKAGLVREAKFQIPILACGIVQREVPKWGVVLSFDSASLGKLGLLLVALGGLGGVVGMFSMAIWPKIAGYIQNGDGESARQGRTTLYFVYAGFVLVLILLVAFAYLLSSGGVFSIKTYVYSVSSLAAFAAFAALVIWEHIHYCMLMATGALGVVARISIAQALVALVLWAYLPEGDALLRYIYAQIIAYLLCSFIAFPIVLQKKISK